MADLGLTAILGGIGAGISAVGTIAGGISANNRAEYEAKVMEQQADEAKAASQREAMNRYREGKIIASDQRAAIAGSGGSLGDAGVIDLMRDTQGQVALAAETDIFKGEQQARGYNDAATMSRFNGKQAMAASFLNAGAGLFSNVSGMYSRFGRPQAATTAASGATAPLYG